jgi:hypothetical protein
MKCKIRESLVKKMTFGLLNFYKSISQKSKHKIIKMEKLFKKGVMVNNRYRVIKQIGKGVFGLVV